MIFFISSQYTVVKLVVLKCPFTHDTGLPLQNRSWYPLVLRGNDDIEYRSCFGDPEIDKPFFFLRNQIENILGFQTIGSYNYFPLTVGIISKKWVGYSNQILLIKNRWLPQAVVSQP